MQMSGSIATDGTQQAQATPAELECNRHPWSASGIPGYLCRCQGEACWQPCWKVGPCQGLAVLDAMYCHTPLQCWSVLLQNQAIDLQFWAEWHRSMGVSRIYLWDHDSSVPMSPAVQDLIDDGYIQYTWFSDSEPAHTDPAQFFVYNRLAADAQRLATCLMF